MMAESLESRKFDRKPLFDVPLPVRPKTREASSATDSENPNGEIAPSTMAFSLLTKRGNRQQVGRVQKHPALGKYLANISRHELSRFLQTLPLRSP